MKFFRNRDARVRGSRMIDETARPSSGLPTHSEIRVDLGDTMIGWKLSAMARGDHDRIDELAMLWSLNRLDR